MVVKKVPTRNVKFHNIKEILGEPLEDKNANSNIVFKSDKVRGSFIDPDWCDGETDEERRVELKSYPYSAYNYLNYGGEDTDHPINVDTPYIYFKNVIDVFGTDHVFNQAQYDYYLTHAPEMLVKIPYIFTVPNKDPGSTNLKTFRNIEYLSNQSEDTYNIDELATRIGLDYLGNGRTETEPRFKIKIKPLLIANIIEAHKIYARTIGVKDIFFPVLPTPPFNSSGTLPSWWQGPFNPPSWSIPIYEAFRNIAMSQWQELMFAFQKIINPTLKYTPTIVGGNTTLHLIATLCIDVSIFYAMMWFADLIWTASTHKPEMLQGLYVYKNMTQDIYDYNDINKSLYSIGLGNKFQLLYDKKENFVNANGKEHNYNFGYEPFRNVKLYEDIITFNPKHIISSSSDLIIGENKFIKEIISNNDQIITISNTLQQNSYCEVIINVNGYNGTVEINHSSFLREPDIINYDNENGIILIRGIINNNNNIIITIPKEFIGYVSNLKIYHIALEYPFNVANKYMNYKFQPRGVQYDLDTPPPIIGYEVEIIPEVGCQLHPYKCTKFVVATTPKKYLAPKFDVILNNTDSRNNLFWNTTITFKHARYCDFIAAFDYSTGDKNFWPSSWFQKFYHKFINTNGAGSGSRNSTHSDNKYILPINNDISIRGMRLMRKESVLEDNPYFWGATPPSDKYTIGFMTEGTSNIVRNSFFRTEYAEVEQFSQEGFKNTLQKFWDYTNHWKIERGAIYKNEIGTGYIKQLCNLQYSSLFVSNFYFLTLEYYCDAGHLYLNTSNTNESVFVDKVYKWWVPYGSADTSVLGQRLEEPSFDDFDTNYDNGNINFIKQGTTKILLKTIRTNQSSSTTFNGIQLYSTSNFIGRVVSVKLSKLPKEAVDNKDRGAYAAAINNFSSLIHTDTIGIKDVNEPDHFTINWKDGPLNIKSFELYVNITPENNNISFTLDMSEQYDPSVNKYHINILYGDWQFTDQDVNDRYININKTYTEVGNYKILVKLTLVAWTKLNSILTEPFSLECHSKSLVNVKDNSDTFFQGVIDLSHSSLRGSVVDEFTNEFEKFKFSNFGYGLTSLILNDTEIEDDVQYITSISNTLNLSNTNAFGLLDHIIRIPSILLDNCKINRYTNIIQADSAITPPFSNYNILWKNSGQSLLDLSYLLTTLVVSSCQYGILNINDIAIDDDASLLNIEILKNRHWDVNFYTNWDLLIDDDGQYIFDGMTLLKSDNGI
jgi:hypothetical protein